MSDKPKPAKTIKFEMSLAQAADIADFLAARGQIQDAVRAYKGILDLDPNMDDIRRRYADLVFRANGPAVQPGTIERGRLLLKLMAWNVLTGDIETAYFENLERLLEGRARRTTPGTLVLGLGSGRCGTTSLAGALAGIEGVCATHENPPLMHWPPTPDQLRVHVRRFRLLLDRFDLVFDSAHWWLNAAEAMNGAFDDMKMIALVRDPDTCARSFLQQKGIGQRAINHWVAHDGNFWKSALWDRLYPDYQPGQFGLDAPDNLDPEELAARQHKLVRAYVADYNAELAEMKKRAGERLLVLRTEELNHGATEERIREFLGIAGLSLQAALNRGTMRDGDSTDLLL